jgi:hypothetical protein
MSAGHQVVDDADPGESSCPAYPLPGVEQMAVLIGMQRGVLSVHEARLLLGGALQCSALHCVAWQGFVVTRGGGDVIHALYRSTARPGLWYVTTGQYCPPGCEHTRESLWGSNPSKVVNWAFGRIKALGGRPVRAWTSAASIDGEYVLEFDTTDPEGNEKE